MSKRKLTQRYPPSNFPSIDLKQFDGVIFPPEIAAFKKKLEEQYFEPHKLTAPGYFLKTLVDAIPADPAGRRRFFEEAQQQAELHFLASWSKGLIKVKDEDTKPMPEEVKIELKEIKLARKIEKEKTKELDKKIKKFKGPKMPVYEDHLMQSEYLKRYRWLMPRT